MYAIFTGISDHLSSIVIHKTKPKTIDTYHLEGFEDCSIKSRDEKYTNPEKPCRFGEISRKIRDKLETFRCKN